MNSCGVRDANFASTRTCPARRSNLILASNSPTVPVFFSKLARRRRFQAVLRAVSAPIGFAISYRAWTCEAI